MFGFDSLNHPLSQTPFGTALEVCLVLAFVAWLLSVITREASWIDRLWSLCPPVYCLIVAFAIGFQVPRVTLMTVLVVLWGTRLTFNFARKGGYGKGGEDYRWAHVRERMSPLSFQLLNITFVYPVQMLLLWLFTAPIHRAWQFRDVPLNWLDFLAAALFLVLLAGETVADRQMWDFQQDKKRRIAAGEDVEQPFMTTGLFRYSRHPNYFCEITMWCVFYLFAVAASGEWLHWSALGCIGLIMLFIPSLRMTEEISVARYPGYRDYQSTTPILIPWPRGRKSASTAVVLAVLLGAPSLASTQVASAVVPATATGTLSSSTITLPGLNAPVEIIRDPWGINHIYAETEYDHLAVGSNTPGQSGDPESPFYENLFELWANDRFFPVFYSRDRIESVAAERTMPTPGG